MKKSVKITLLLIAAISFPAIAHQPVLDDNENPHTRTSPFVIDKPEVSKAIFSELNGQPDYFQIKSDQPFDFYVGITQAKLDNCPRQNWFSIDILDDNFEIINQKNGKDFDWWPWYEKFGKKWYWVGPEIGEDFASNRVYDAGTYYIRVYNQNNQGKYVLATGDDEKFGPFVIARTLVTLPTINNRFWNQPQEECRPEN